MKAGSDEHEELLWRLAMQLAAQLPVEKADRAKVLDYMTVLSSSSFMKVAADRCKTSPSPEERRKELKAV